MVRTAFFLISALDIMQLSRTAPRVSILCLLGGGGWLQDPHPHSGCLNAILSVLLGDCLPVQYSTLELVVVPLVALVKEAPTKADMAASLPGSMRTQDSRTCYIFPHVIRKKIKSVLLNAMGGNLG